MINSTYLYSFFILFGFCSLFYLFINFRSGKNQINNKILEIDQKIAENSKALIQAQIVKLRSSFSSSNNFIERIGENVYKKKLEESINWHQKQIRDLYLNRRKLQINLALNYGSKAELLNAFKNLNKNKEKINEKNLIRYLQTKNIPDPDILIRTGNTKRLSNFLLWQLAYSEIFFEKKLWPDFNEKDYYKIIKKYKNIKRNFGNI